MDILGRGAFGSGSDLADKLCEPLPAHVVRDDSPVVLAVYGVVTDRQLAVVLFEKAKRTSEVEVAVEDPSVGELAGESGLSRSRWTLKKEPDVSVLGGVLVDGGHLVEMDGGFDVRVGAIGEQGIYIRVDSSLH